jgi:methyl acetate hydrolase
MTGRMDETLDRAAATAVVPGAIAIVGDRDRVVYERAVGRLSADRGEPVRADTMLWLASLAKAITSVAALQLVERRSLDLEQPVASVLPAFGELQVLEGFEGDVPRLRAPARQGTVRHLLTHTAGLAYWFANTNVLRYYDVAGVDPFAGKLAALRIPLVADPGTRWDYGISTDWLGQIVEAVSGEELASYCAQHIFVPLGMADATFRPNGSQLGRQMTVHARTPDGGLAPAPIDFAEPEFCAGGHGLFGTAGDYLRFLRALLRGGELDGERVLRRETVDLAFTNHLDGIALPAPRWRTAVPELSNDVHPRPYAQGWGLGFQLTLEDVPGLRRAGTADWAGLCNCYFWIDRTAGIAAALATQVLPFFDERVVETVVDFERAVYAELATGA